MAKRSKRTKCARTEFEAEEAFDNADVSMNDSIDDAKMALKMGRCAEAGTFIDHGYVAYGRMLENAPPGSAEWAQAVDQYKRLKEVDKPFEAKCVRYAPEDEDGVAHMRHLQPSTPVIQEGMPLAKRIWRNAVLEPEQQRERAFRTFKKLKRGSGLQGAEPHEHYDPLDEEQAARVKARHEELLRTRKGR